MIPPSGFKTSYGIQKAGCPGRLPDLIRFKCVLGIAHLKSPIESSLM